MCLYGRRVINPTGCTSSNFGCFFASDIRQPNLEVAKERLKQVITKVGEDDFPEISSDLPQVNDLLSRLSNASFTGQFPISLSWMDVFIGIWD
ncbi:hypothetical protein PVK06_017970 [Gossypium arboreum]|uniref:Uncharacterized protein n=1 Tax=Gossypium arboreum TaxID=29729 RepID=A0ABR0Q4X9_GOSAR|nr:hypothetical protein PVK06_017970 [Gossypium arboreum]